jgi:prolipoprotein diacylglyceryltransferase
MYPDLSYLLHDLFGTNLDNAFSIIKTFGFMLALAFLGSGWIVKKELKRYEEEGKLQPLKKQISEIAGFNLTEFIINTAITFIIGGKIPFIAQNFSEFKADPASVLFSKSGNWAIGIIAAMAYAAYYYFSKKGKPTTPVVKDVIIHPYQKSADIVIVSAISGVLGARIFSIFENLDGFAKDPIGTLFSGSGLTVYGGVIVGFIVVYWYIKKFGIKPIHMMDISGMAILVGLTIGRLGCQLSGDGDWGIVASAQPEWWFLPDWSWAYDYPNNVGNDDMLLSDCNQSAYNDALRIRGNSVEDACEAGCGYRYCHKLAAAVFPTPIYEIVLYSLGFGILWLLRKRIQIAGILFFLYMIYNGIVRFYIEKIRVNDKYEMLGFNWSQAQYISIAFILIGIIAIGILIRNHKKSTS